MQHYKISGILLRSTHRFWEHFNARRKKKRKLACYDLLHCLSVSIRNTNLLSFLPLFGTDPTFLLSANSLLTLL